MNKLDYAINSCKISVILILVLTALFRIFIMLNPSITSYAVIVENAYSEDLNLSISQSSEQTIALQNPGELSSLKISGNVIGKGTARVYLKVNDARFLIFDNSLSKNNNLITANAVAEGLNLSANETNNLTENIIANETADAINQTNNPPLWISEISSFAVDQGSSLTLNLSNYFSDADNDTMSYLASSNENVDVVINNFVSLMTITPKPEFSGNSSIILFAGDGKELTTKEITIIVNPAVITAFEFECAETCFLNNITANEITLIAELENASLQINSIDYTVFEQVSANVSNISIEQNITNETAVNETIPALQITNITIKKFHKTEIDKNFKAAENAEFELEFVNETELIKENKAINRKNFEKKLNKWAAENETVEANVVYNFNNEKINFDVEIEEIREGKFFFNIIKPRQFRPGIYTLEVNFTRSGESTIISQDFAWGVLAINTHKSIYLPDETTKLGIGVLNDAGSVVCDAALLLEITDPFGIKTILSSENGGIIRTQDCYKYGDNVLPDYIADYIVNIPGVYVMNLTAETYNGIRNLIDNFTVASSVDFDVERIGPTRIWPPAAYNVSLVIKANKNYNGQIIEKVPLSFDISNVRIEVVEETSSNETIQQLNLKGINLENKKEKINGSLNQVKLSDQDNNEVNDKVYKSFGFFQDGVKPRMLNQVERLPEKQVSDQDMRVQNSYSFGDESPVRGAQNSGNEITNKIIELIKAPEAGIIETRKTTLNLAAPDFAVVDAGDHKEIIFNANLKKGGKYKLSYAFDAPDESPQFYLLGKADIGSFSEERHWQIASDQVLSDNDASSSINDTTLTEGDSAAVVISYSTDNFGVGSYVWVVNLVLKDTNTVVTNINGTCSNKFNVTSMSFSCPGGQSCVANLTAGTATLDWAKSKTGTVTWNILACSGSSSSSPYNITWNETSTTGQQITWNTSLITVAAPPDTTLPSVLQQYPANNSINNTGTVNFNCSATDNTNLKNISLWGNFTGTWALNDSWCNVTGTAASCQWNKTLPSNTYIWGCRAFDLANNSNWTMQNWTLIVDTLSPTFSNALNSSGWQYDNVTMNITISNNAVDGYIFSTNITGTWANDSWVDITSNPTTYNANTTKNISLAAGVGYGWKYYANDTAKNIGESITYNATVKTDIMPNISLISPSDGTSSVLTNFTFKAAGTDDRALVNATFYWNYSGTWLSNGTVTMSGTSAQANFTRDNLAFGSYIWNVQFCDSIGQCNFSLTNYSLTLRAANVYCAGNYTEGSDWIVSRNITCANETIYMTNNITILNNGSLYLYNVTLNFSMFTDGSNFINKSPNGGLFIYDLDSNASTQEDGSWIMSNDSNFEFDFWAFGNGLNDNFTMRNSKVSDAGYSTNSQGIQLYNVSNVVVSGNNVSGGVQYGVYLQYSTNNNISSNNINITGTGSDSSNIYLLSSSNSNTLSSNTITTDGNTNNYGIYLKSSSNSNNVSGNTITTKGSSGVGIYLLSSSNSNTLTNNEITTNGSNGIGIIIGLGSGSNTLSSNTITTNGSSGYGIEIGDSGNTNITGNTITTSNTNGWGIHLLSNAQSNTLTSNTITTNGSTGYGIYLNSNLASQILISNTITTSGSSGVGIYLLSSSNNNATNNVINATGTNADGVYIFADSDNNILNLNNISKSGRDGIRIENSGTSLPERNNITNNIILNATGNGIFINNTLTASQFIYNNNISYSSNNSIQLNNASNITIIAGSLEYSRVGINASQSLNVTIANATFVLSTLWDFYIMNNSWLISLNNSFNSTAVNITGSAGDFSNFTVMWYARANVTNSSGIHMNSSSVTSTDVFGASEWTDTTTNGLTGWFAVIDYVQNASSINSSNLHTGTASLTGYLANSSTYNISVKNITGTQVDIVLKNQRKFCNNSYIEGQATWNITSNITCTNETIYVAGNITVYNNGSLTLYNVTINFSAFADGSNFINKSPNGGLYIYDLDSNASTQEDGSWLMSNDSNYEYDFWAFGNGGNDNFTMRNSKITDAGYSTNSQGIQLYNISNAVVLGNNISEGAQYGLYLQYSTNNNISSNTITTSGSSGYGIYLASSSNSNTLSSNIITTNGSNGYGIYIESSNNPNISNNNVNTKGNSGYGIWLYSIVVNDINSGVLTSNIITTNGTSGYGIFVQRSINLTSTSNTITTSGGSGYGIRIDSSSNNNATSNTINATGTNADGIYIFSTSRSNTINFNNISKSGRDGIRIENSGTSLPERNNITNNIILNSTGNGIFLNNTLTASQFIYSNNISYSSNNSIQLNNASNITIIAGSLEYSRTGINASQSVNVTITNATFVLNTLWDFYITNNSWITSLNNSFNKTAVNVTNSGDYSNFTVQWYARANVTNSSGIHMNSSSVTSTDVYSASEWTDTTTNGLTGWFAVIDYVQNGTTIVDYNLHTAAASLTSYVANSSTYNVSVKNITGTQVDIVLKNPRALCNGNYTELQVSWNITSNVTCANETIPVYGNITIFSNGSLTLRNVTLIFQASSDGYNFINKSPNGGLFIYDLDNNASTQEDATEINTTNSDYEFDFWVYGNGGSDNFTMQNSILKDAGYSSVSQGIYLYNISNVKVIGNNISDGALYGLWLRFSSNNNVTSNTITTSNTNGYGIYLRSSSNNNISSNTITTNGSSGFGIYLYTSSSSNTIQSNTITTIKGSGYGINLDGITGSNSNNNVTGNIITTNGSSGYGIYLLVNANLNTIQGNTITTNGSLGYGILLSSNSYSILQGNIITVNNATGIYFSVSSNNNATGNMINATGANADGIYIFSNSDNNIFNLNNISKSGRDGIRIENSGTSLPERNNITNNIILNATGNGIFLNNTKTASQLLFNNNITYSGINYAAVKLINASNITIIGGIIENNTIGINATKSINVTIANATFIGSALWDFYATDNAWITSLNNSFNHSSVNVTRTYTADLTFSGISKPTRSHNATYGSSTMLPPVNLVNGTEFASAQYSGIVNSDDSIFNYSTTRYSYHKFSFRINRSLDKTRIENLTVLWEGKASNATRSLNASLYIWNSTQWETAANTTGDGSSDENLTKGYANATAYIDAYNMLHLLAIAQSNASSNISTDYVRVSVLLIDASNFTVQWYVDVNVTGSDSNAIAGATVFAYENSSGSWSQRWADVTADSGFTGKWAVIEYVQNATSFVNYTSNFTANVSTRENSTIKYIASSQQVDVRIPVQNGSLRLTSPANETKLDRDAANTSVADFDILTAVLSDSGANVNITFYANLTNPNISGQTMVVLGSNLTNSSGYATLIFNPGSSLYAGNYTWWSIAGSIGSYNGSETRTLLIYGGLNATFRNSTSTPNATYSPGEEVIIEALLNSLGGPETAAQINSSYLANVSAYLMQPNGTAIRVQMIDPAAAVGNTTSPFSCGNNCKSCREAGNGTIDSCYDGSSCTVVYVNNITAVDLTDNEFSTGDTVQVNISVYNCFGPGNHEVAIAYNNGSGWVNKYNGATNNGACTLENNHTATFTLDDVSGTHNIRGIIAYTGATNMTCGSDADAVGSDTDDINITVNAKNYWNGSYVLPSTALSGQWNVTLNSSANWFFGNSSGDRNFTVAGDYVAPIVTLNSPINYYNETSTSTITFNCSATDNVNLTNITLYGNWSGWHANETKYVAGTSNSATFTKNLTNGTYTWNCLAFDNYSNSAFASANFTLSVFPKTYCNGNYTDGTDWIVNKNVTCANETIYVTGNITILNNASLYLYNATLIFESFADGSNFINKSPNGGLFIYDLDSNASTQEDATEINTTNSDFEFDFWVYGNGGNDNFTLQNSIVREAGYSGGSLGIRLYNVSNVVISGNNVSSGAYYSLYLRYSTNNNITNNTVTTSGGTGIGIYLLSSSNSNTLQSNTITTNGSSGYGIFLSSSSNSNTLQGNTITTAGSDGYGIYLDISSNSNITNNTITTNGGSSYGIWLDIISNSNKLQSNTITTNGGSSWGIYFSSSSSSNTLQSNTITTNGTNSHGIYLLTSSNNNATSNIINATGTNADGVYVFSNSDNNIFNLNNISKSGRDGIRIEGSTNERNNITNNIILNSTGSGIFLNNTKTAFQFIYNNNISYSSNSSIQLNNASNITIISGSLEYSRTGINASQSVNVTIANATFVLSALWDFYITNNSWITSLNNTFNKSAVNITNAAGDYSNFTNQYYVDVNVTGSDSNAVSGATVFAYENSSGSWSQRWADVTADSGFTGKWAVTEYFQNATNIINYTSNFTANYTTRENSTIKYIASSQQADVRIPVQIGTLFLISPANETKLDRDAVNASVADSDILIANITSSTANVNITFYANLTNPSISGQTMVVLGSNLTNSSGYATLIFNPNSSIYAGNYTWWAASGSYNGSETRTLLIYGGLNTTFRNNATTPNATYSPGEEVIIEALLNSSGVENATQLNSTYLANVSAYLMQPNGTTIRVQLTASVAAVGGTSSATGYPVRVMYNNVTTDGGTHLGGIENSDGSYGVKYKLGSWSAAATGIGFRNSVNSDWINETITYSWIEINATGTAVTLSDDSVSSTINMPFNISFLNGTRYDKLRISSNGYIYFNTNESSAGCCDGVDIPNPALPNNYVAGYWEDLNPAIGGKIYYKTAGSAPTRAFIVEFDGVYHYSGDSSTTVTFQIVFNETDQVNSTANITNASIWNGSYVLPSTALAGQWNVTLNSSADWFFGNSSGGRNFTVSDTTLPVVTLNSPINYYNETSTNTITFNCSATDNVNLTNITLYGNWSGWHANETKYMAGTSNSATFTKNLTNGTYIWNCLAFDSSSNSAYASSNFTFSIFPKIYCNGNYTDGSDWIINRNVTCANETIYVAGNITISNNGSLTLYNVTINFSAFADGSNFINKSPNGGLFIYDLDSNASTIEDATEIISNNSDYEFDFWVYGNGVSDNFTMQNSIVKDAGYSTKSLGIQLYNVSNVKVIGNNISDGAYYGLYLQYSTNNNISNNIINTTANNGYGIYLSSSSNSTIQSNTITTNGSWSYGILIDASSNSNTLQSNTITTSNTNGYGIYLVTSSNNNATSNTITTSNTNGYGIYLFSNSNSNTIQSNTITTNGSFGYGIYLLSSSNSNTLQSNTITTNGSSSYGIFLSTTLNNISSNAIITNNATSIYLSGSSNNNLTSNRINATGTIADGIYVFASSDNNIINLNNITKAGRDGIRFENSGTALPERNNITNNIILNATGSGIFLNNTLTASQLIYNNNISYSSNNSILLNNASNITIISGSLEYSRTGINATSSRNVTIANATFVLNTLWDFYVTTNSWITSLNNTFNKSAVNITGAAGDFSNFTVMWYARANVTNSSGSAMNAASVTSTDVYSGTEWTDTTTNGLTGWFAVIDYVQTATSTNSFNMHTGAASLTGYLPNSTTYNVSIKNITGTQVDVVLKDARKFCNGNYTEGQATWNITSNVTCANQTIYVAGNITIFNNGSLTLYNVTINFSMFADGSNFINKSPNGGLYIYDSDSNASTQEDATEIISNNGNYEFDFWIYGNSLNDNFTMKNSIIKDAGYSFGSQGIQLFNVSNAIITGNNISEGSYYGLYMQYSQNNNISGNTIITNGSFGYGIYLVSSSNSSITGNTITTAGSNGIWLSSSSNSTISNNAIIANGKLSFSPMLDINYSQSINTTGYECYRTTHKANFSANQVRVAFAAGNGSFTPLAASVAKAINATAIYLNTRRQLFFGSLPYRSIPSNQFDASDWTNLSIQQGENLTIQFLVPDNGGGDLSITNGSSFKYAAGPGAASDATYYTTNSNLTFCNATNIAEWNSSVYFSSSASSYIYGIAWIEFRNTTDTSDGIYIFSDSDNNRIDRNNITKAGRDGIRIEVSESFVPERNNITNNVILNATQNGILINQTGTASQLMQNNNITYSGINYAAVKLINASNITIIGGFMQNNTVGINASQSINITVANVTFTGSALWDFYITNNSWLISLNNSFNKSAVNVTGRSSSTTTYNYSNFQQYWNDSNSTGTALYSAGLFDYDGDGSLNDIVFGGIGRLSAFYQNGTPLWNWTGGNSTNDYVYDIEIINNRTIAAILNTGATNGSLIILDRNSNLICNTSDLGTAYAAAAGDFNQDGNKSEIVVGESGDIFAFYSNCTQIWTDSSPVGNAGDVETGDLNNDGYYDDIAVADAGSGPTDGGILVYNGSGDFQWNVSGTASLSVEIGDIDGNGVDDIVAQSFTNYELLAYNGSGYNLWNFTDPTYDIYEIRFGNFSNKGIIAFVANNIITSSTLYVLNASGNQSWNASLPSLDTQGWFSLAVGDLDNDGLDDIVVGSDDATPFQVLMFNNSGSNLWNYTTGNDIGSIYADGALEIADIDGDGKKDVIAASQDNYGYVLYANRTVSAIISNDYSNFTNQYYVDVNVTWSNSSAVSGATVLAYENSTSSWVQRWTDTTASNGFTGKWAVIEYVQNATNIVNYTSNFTANYSDQANSTLKYITSSQQVDVRLNSTAAAPPSNATFNITFLITKALAPDMVMAASNETINVTTTVKVNRTTNSISFINITDEIPYDFIYENESRIAVLFINWSDAGSNTIDITANATKTIVKNGGTANTWLIINISNMSTSLGYYMTENDSIQINYLMNSSKMNANDTRLIYTNVTVKDIASNTAADFKLTNITSSQIVLRGYKKISVDPANPQNATVGIEMTSLGGKLTGILMADYLPNAISGKSGLIGLNITYYNKTSNSYKTLTEPEDYKLYNPYNSTLPDNQAASVFSYNFSYNFTNWDGTLYENDSLLINYSVVIAGGGSWTLPAIIGGWDPQYQKHIKTQMYTQVSVPSFDVITKVLTPKIKPGENVKALLQMLNVGGPKAKVDVFVTYSMKTMIGELITERSETLAVVEQKEKELILATPSTVKPGMYTFETFVTYTGREAVSTDVFEVLGEKGSGFNAQWLMFGMFGLVMVLAIIFAIIRVRKW